MHPQTTWEGMTYVQWLDAFLSAAKALDDWDVQFVHFQDLALRTAPLPPTPAPAPVPPTPAPGPGCKNKAYGQCGGENYKGPTCCPVSQGVQEVCMKQSQYYSQCCPPPHC